MARYCGDGERREVVVAEKQNPPPHERVGLVHGEHAPQLRPDRALTLV